MNLITQTVIFMTLVASPAFVAAQSIPTPTTPAVGQVPSAQPEGSSESDSLNQAQSENVRAEIEEFAERLAKFERDMADHRAAVAQAAAVLQSHEAALQRHNAEVQRQNDEYQAAYARWQADVAACNAGDFARCQASTPAPR